jgi:hypothetical protein
LQSAHAGYKGHRVVMDRREVAITYAKGWFVPDLISSFPYELVLVSSSYVGLVKVSPGYLANAHWP